MAKPPRHKTHAALTVWIPRELLAHFRAIIARERGPQPGDNGDHGPVDVVREFIAQYVAEHDSANEELERVEAPVR